MVTPYGMARDLDIASILPVMFKKYFPVASMKMVCVPVLREIALFEFVEAKTVVRLKFVAVER